MIVRCGCQTCEKPRDFPGFLRVDVEGGVNTYAVCDKCLATIVAEQADPSD